MKKAAIALAVVLALAVGAGLIAPSFIDWNAYRGEIARQVESATGRPLALEGPVELALLPSPRLRALGVSLPSPPGSSTRELLRVREFEMLLNWGALLQGRLEVASLRLVEPEFWFEVLADGRNAWMLPIARLGGGEAITVEGINLRAARIEQVRVTGGRVYYRNARTGAAETFERIDGEMSADSLDGPARASGVVTVRGQLVRFDLAVGDFSQARPVPVALTLNTDATTRVSYRGTLTRGEGNARIQGRIQAEAPSLAGLLAAFTLPIDGLDGALAAAAARRVTVNGQMTLGGDGLAVNDVAIELGDLRAGAAATIAFAAVPAIDVALAVGHVDLDKLEAEHARARPARPRAAAPAQPTLTLPRGLDANLDLSVETLTVGQSVIRQAKLNASLNRGNLVVTNGAAELPGGTAVSAFGQIAADGRLDGVIEVNATNLRALLAWLGLDPAGVPPQRLRRLEASARIEGTLAQPEIAAIDARFDGARLTGGIAVGRGPRPAFGIDLSLDQLNLDAYRMPGASSLGVLALPVWAGFDANLRLALDRLVVGGETLEAIALDGTLRAGTLDLRALDIRVLAEATLGARGRALALGRAPELDLEWTIKAANAQRLLALFGFDTGATGALAASGRLAGAPGGRLRLSDLDLSLGELRARGTANLDVAADPPLWQARLEAESLDLDALARAETTAAGRAALRPSTPTPWPSTPLDLARLTRGQGEIALAARRLTLLGQELGEARIDAVIAGGALDLRSLAGALHGGQLAMSGRLDGPGLRARGTLTGARLESLLAGAFGVALAGAGDVTFDLTTSGNDANALARALSGSVALALREARLDGIDLPGVVRRLADTQSVPDLAGLAAIATAGGATPIDVATGTFALERGIARSDDLSLVSRDGQAQLRGTLDIGRWTADLALAIELGHAADAPGVSIAVSGPIDQPRIEPDFAELSEYLARRASTQGATDPGAR